MVRTRHPTEPSDEDRAALDRLDVSLRRSLVSYFRRRTGDRADIEDMVQEVFERLLKRGGAAALETQNPGAYVFETASSVLTDHFRKKVAHRASAHEPFDLNRHGDADFSPEHVLIHRERLARVSAMLFELPERTRAVFILRRIESMRAADVAARLGISISAVEKHMRKAIQHIAQRMGRER